MDSNRIGTFSISHISNNLFKISVSLNFAYRRMAHRLCIGSMILLDKLHAKQKRVVFEYISIVLLRACCAPAVILDDRVSINQRKRSSTFAPVSLVQNHNFVSPGRKGDLLLCESLYFIPHDIDSSGGRSNRERWHK